MFAFIDKQVLGLVNSLLARLVTLYRFVRFARFHLALAVVMLSLGFYFQHLYRSFSIRSASGRVQVALVQIESSQRLYLLTSNRESLRKYYLYRKVLASRLVDLCHLIPANVHNQNLCGSIQRLIAMKLLEMQTTIDLAQMGKISAAISLVRSNVGVEYEDEIERELDMIRLREGVANGPLSACLINQ